MNLGSMGWIAALTVLGGGALWNSQRPGVMTEERDRLYRECLSGRVPIEKMREMARAFERARCHPQARMLLQRIALQELPPELQEQRRAIYQRALRSKNKPAILKVAQAFDDQGATTSAAKLRRHAEKLPPPVDPAAPIVTPPPGETMQAGKPKKELDPEPAPEPEQEHDPEPEHEIPTVPEVMIPGSAPAAPPDYVPPGLGSNVQSHNGQTHNGQSHNVAFSHGSPVSC